MSSSILSESNNMLVEKSAARGRFWWLRTKRAITLLSALVIAAIVLIALGATGTLGSHYQDTQKSVASNSTFAGGDQTSSVSPEATISSTNSQSTASAISSATTTSRRKSSATSSTSSVKATTTSSFVPINGSSIDDGVPLRIMALGASLVRGERSTGYKGWRSPMREKLVKLGVPVNMVGSQRLGEFLDNNLEGYPGYTVSESHDAAKKVVPKMQPNLFIVHVGTNNALKDIDVDKAGEDMEDFIDYLLETSNTSTVVMSTLLTNLVPDTEPKILEINEQFRTTFAKYDGKKPVVLAEMHPSSGLPNRPQVEDIGPDLTHPYDAGYELMANIFLESIQEADDKGFLQWPVDNGYPYDGNAGRTE